LIGTAAPTGEGGRSGFGLEMLGRLAGFGL
jgi:hypothetical protein